MKTLRLTLCSAILALSARDPGLGAGEAPRLLAPQWERMPPAPRAPLAVRPAFQALLTARHRGYRRFLQEHPGRWEVVWNEATRTPHRIFGDALGLPGIGADASGAQLSSSDLDRSLRAFLARHPGLFPLDPEENLVLLGERHIGRLRQLVYGQLVDGIPVLGGRLELRLDANGHLISLANDTIPDVLLDGWTPAEPIAADTAIQLLGQQIGQDSMGYRPPESRLVIAPVRVRDSRADLLTGGPSAPHTGGVLRPVLAWEVRLSFPPPAPSWCYYLTATSEGVDAPGRLLGRLDRTARISLSGRILGRATPGLGPDSPTNPPIPTPLSNLTISTPSGSTVTAGDGTFTLEATPEDSENVDIRLGGPFCEVINDAGQDLLHGLEIENEGRPLITVLNEEPDEPTTAQVNAFVGVNRAHDFIRGFLPGLDAIDVPLRTRVNVDDDCNAYFSPADGGEVGFLRSGACANSAYSTIVYHEYGHFLLWKIYDGRWIMPAYGEGFSDALAILMTGQPVIGESYNGASPQVAPPMRDVARATLRYPADVLRAPQEAGTIFARAVWRLRELLVERLGEAAGAALASRLTLESALLAPTGISPDLVIDFLQLDDDDGRLWNGSPNGPEIVAAFASTGLVLPGSLVFEHEPLETTTSSGPFPVEVEVRSQFTFIRPSEVTLRYSLDGGASYRDVLMESDGSQVDFHAEIPPVGETGTVKYYFQASTDELVGIRSTHPSYAPGEETFFFDVGEPVRVAFDDFDDLDDEGPEAWRHDAIQNGQDLNEDDWQHGNVRQGSVDPLDLVSGPLLDPEKAFSEPFHWGNDLALVEGADNQYADLSHNFLLSPSFDCTGRSGVRLRFRRCLTSERLDRFRILVNEQVIFESPETRDVFDSYWRRQDFDISSIADGNPAVEIRFDLRSNSFATAGGWNIDDFEIVSVPHTRPAAPDLRAVEPPYHSLEGGASFNLVGAGFPLEGEVRVFFGELEAADLRVVDGETITGTIPASPTAGGVDVRLETARGGDLLPGAFDFFGPPEIDVIEPGDDAVRGGSAITIHGRYFTAGGSTRAWIGGRRIEDLEISSSSRLAGTVPPGETVGPVDVRIETAYYESVFPGRFQYLSPPEIASLIPSEGGIEGGYPFLVTGRYFPRDVSTVEITIGETRVADAWSASSMWISGTVPPGPTDGPVDVRVTTPGGTAILRAGFYYTLPREEPEPIFVRGDVDLNHELDITDQIIVLGVLFLGRGKIQCRDAADANDDGFLDISDPIFALDFMFTGGEIPPEPFPLPAPDPTEDFLGCERGLLAR